jgi:hypothetical protein
MNALGPPKQKRAPEKSALRILGLRGAYHVASVIARVLGTPFWFAEQWRGKLADKIDNDR